MKKFVNEANQKYGNYFYRTLDPEETYVYQYKPAKYANEEGIFEPKIMSVNKTFSNVYLSKNIKEEIKKDIDTFLTNKSFYIEKGIPYKRGYLLYGPPGTGKNSLVYAVAREYKMNLYKLDLKQTSELVKQAIYKIPPHSVIFIDEIDMNIYNDRITETESKKEREKFPLSVLMDILDGYDYLNDCIVFLTTNYKDVLDPSLIRPGRVDLHFFLDKLDSEDICKTIKLFSGFDIVVPKQVSMTSSSLINQILLPNKDNCIEIQRIITNFTI